MSHAKFVDNGLTKNHIGKPSVLKNVELFWTNSMMKKYLR